MAVTQGAPSNSDWVDDASLPTLKDRYFKEKLFGEEPINGYASWIQNASSSTVEKEFYKREVLSLDSKGKYSNVGYYSEIKNTPIDHVITYAGRGVEVNHSPANDALTPIADNELFTSFAKRLPAKYMVNAGGWWVNTMRRMGLLIVNGNLIQDWETSPHLYLCNDALVFMKDGSLKYYNKDTPGKKIIEDGGWNASVWGAPIYLDGKSTGRTSEAQYIKVSGRQLLGDLMDGTKVFITVPGVTDQSGADGPIMEQIAESIPNLNNLIMLDGGGSTQTYDSGVPLIRSSDSSGDRAVCSVYWFSAHREKKTKGSFPVKLNADITTPPAIPLSWSMEDGVLTISGSITGTFPLGGLTISRLPIVGEVGRQEVILVPASGLTFLKCTFSHTSGDLRLFGEGTAPQTPYIITRIGISPK